MLFAIWGSLAGAAELRLDLDAALQRAWETSAARAVALHRAEAARGAARADRAPANPELRLRASDLGSRVEALGGVVRVRQDLEAPGALRRAGEAGLAEADALEAEAGLEREQVRADAAELFDEIRLLAEAERLADEEIALCRRRVELAGRRLDAGLEVADDLIAAEVAVAAAVRRGQQARVERVLREGALAVLVGADPGDTLILEGPSLREQALSAAPEPPEPAGVAYGRSRVAAAEARVAAERAAVRPFFNWVEAGVGLEVGRVPSLEVAAALDVPVFQPLARGAVDEADAEVEEARDELAAHERAFAARTSAARTALAEAQAAIAALEEAIAVAQARLDALGDRVAPDRRVDLEVDLLDERRRVLDLIAVALEARRALLG